MCYSGGGCAVPPLPHILSSMPMELLEDKCLSSGNRYADVNPSGTDTMKTSAAAAEAGRQRRRASADLQFKVFDPGGD